MILKGTRWNWKVTARVQDKTRPWRVQSKKSCWRTSEGNGEMNLWREFTRRAVHDSEGAMMGKVNTEARWCGREKATHFKSKLLRINFQKKMRRGKNKVRSWQDKKPYVGEESQRLQGRILVRGKIKGRKHSARKYCTLGHQKFAELHLNDPIWAPCESCADVNETEHLHQ